MKHQHNSTDTLILLPGKGRVYNCGPMTAIFKADENETNGKYSISEWWLEPGSTGPGAHSHEDNDEVFYVLEGTTSFLVGDKWINAEKGAFIRIPANTIHDFTNKTNEKTGILNFFIPGGFEKDMPEIVKWFEKNPPNNLQENYKTSVELNTTPEKVFNALTNEIFLWWTEMFEGAANQKDKIFTVRFGSDVYKTIRVQELIVDSKISWLVTASIINIPGLKKQQEWKGTSIIWEILANKNNTRLHLSHIGLNPSIECYDICTKGWQQFISSLKLFVETGKGKPFKTE